MILPWHISNAKKFMIKSAVIQEHDVKLPKNLQYIEKLHL